MDVVVSGKNSEVTPDLREHTLEKVERISKYAHDVRRVDVDYTEIKNPRVRDAHTCEILVHLTGNLVKAAASAVDQHSALDLALDKVEHQMRRLHSRRTTRREARRDGGRGRAAVVADRAEATSEVGAAPGDEAEGEPVIVKTKQFVVKPMDPGEAALQMDLLGHDFFLFTNADNGRSAVIYRRRDGNYGLIEAQT